MIGNVDELKNPAKYVRKHMQNEDFIPNFIKCSSFSTNDESIQHHNYVDYYPQVNKGGIAHVNGGTNTSDSQPSIRGRKLYIPLECWFCDNSKYSMLVAVQNQEMLE